MTSPTISQIINVIESVAPLHLQESYDNCGLLVGNARRHCTGVMLCVDITPAIVSEAVEAGSNLIISHHPVIFRGLKHLSGEGSLAEQAIIAAIVANVAIYACHTSIDNAPGIGVSHTMAKMLGLTDASVLMPVEPSNPASPGSGVVGTLSHPLKAGQLIELVKTIFNSPVARCSAYPGDKLIERVALCGGSGESFLPAAIASGAQAYITSDTRYHAFVDNAGVILIIDIGHFESENCTKQIFYTIIKEKFPNFAVRCSQTEINPINYL